MEDNPDALREKLRHLLRDIRENFGKAPRVVADLLLSALDCKDGGWAIWQSAVAIAAEAGPPSMSMVLAYAAAEANDRERFKDHEDTLRDALKPRPPPPDPPEFEDPPRGGF